MLEKTPPPSRPLSTAAHPSAKDDKPVKPVPPDSTSEAAKGETPSKSDVKPVLKAPPTSPPKPIVTPKLVSVKPDPPKPGDVAKPVSLDNLLAAVDLPASKDTTTAVSLGKLDWSPNADLDIRLLGRDSIAKGLPTFELQKNEGDPPTWTVLIAGKNKDEVPLGQIYMDEAECKFQWTADGKDRASPLRFCELQFISGGKKHVTALIAPKTVPPLVIDLNTATTRQRLTRGFALPDASLLRLQILPLDKTMPKYETKVQDNTRPARAGSARPAGNLSRGKILAAAWDTIPVKGRAVVSLTKERTPRVALTISFDVRGKDVLLDMQGACEIANRSVPFTFSALNDFAATVNEFLMMNEINKNRRKPTASDEQLKLFKTAQEELKAVNDLGGEMNQKGSIPFRIYVTAGQADDATAAKIVIFESGPVEPAKPSLQKKDKVNRQRGRMVPNADAAKKQVK